MKSTSSFPGQSLPGQSQNPAHTAPTTTPTNGVPDLDFIKKNVPITAIATELGLSVSGQMMHCWRPDQHQHGDRTASVGFIKRTNKGKCFVCDDLPFSNVDLVMNVLGCSTIEAIRWIAARFPVPTIPKGRHLRHREQLQPFSRVGLGGRLETIVRSGLWAALSHSEKAILAVFCELAEANTHNLRISYRGLMRFAGVRSCATVAGAIKHFERICLLRVERELTGDGLRACNSYHLTLDHQVLLKHISDIYERQQAEIKAERELREEERKARRAQRQPLPVKPLYNHCSAEEIDASLTEP